MRTKGGNIKRKQRIPLCTAGLTQFKIMLKSCLSALLILLSCNAFAQFAISGTVKEAKTNHPLSGATVQLEGTNNATLSDEFGHFQFEKLKEGSYTVHVKFIGYADKTENVTLNANVELTILLEENFQLTEEVIVYATRANDKTPTTFSNVSKDAIQKQNFGQDLPIILNWTPSMVTTSNAGAGVGYTGMRIRGSDATRVNVTINGIPYNDSESQGTYWVDIPDVASSTQSIQIQRGVGTSTNGGSAFGASVNLQTNTFTAEPYAEIYTSAGSFNTQRYTAKAGTGIINNHWAFDAKVSKITSDGYVNRASSDLSSYYISGGYYGKKTMLKAITFGGHETTYQSWNGVDSATLKNNRRFNSCGAIYDENGNVVRYYNKQVDDYRQDHYQLHLTHRINDNWNANVSLHYTYGRGYYESYLQGQNFSDLGLSNVMLKDTTLTSGDFVVRQWLDNKFYGTTASLNYEQGKINLTIGGAWNRYGNAKHYGEITWAQYAAAVQPGQHYYDGTGQKTDFNIYTKLNYNFAESLNGFIDLQYRYVGYRTAGVESYQNPYDIHDMFNFFNPKLGLSYTLSDKDVLYSSYAIANREPNRSDYIDGTVKPKPEKLGDLEIGWRRNSSHFSFETSYYLMNYTDQLVLTGKLDNVGYPIRANVGKSYRTGLEVSGTIRISKKVSWNANVTVSQNKNKDYVSDESKIDQKKNTSIILSPGVIAGSQLAWVAFKNFQATFLTKYVGKQYLDNTQNENLTLDSYFINDLRFNYQVTPKGIKQIGLSFLLNNIFDVKYSSDGYVYDKAAYYYPQAGRNFLAMLTLKF